MLPVDIVIIFASLVVIAVGVTGLFGLFLSMPYVPTPKAIANEMVTLARMCGTETVFDLGAGDGAILLAAKRRHPGIRATGVELSPFVWLLGKARIACSGHTVALRAENAFRTDVREADVIFLYALPKFLMLIQPKFDRELRPGTCVISHAFSFPEKAPAETMTIPWGKKQRTLYRYVW